MSRSKDNSFFQKRFSGETRGINHSQRLRWTLSRVRDIIQCLIINNAGWTWLVNAFAVVTILTGIQQTTIKCIATWKKNIFKMLVSKNSYFKVPQEDKFLQRKCLKNERHAKTILIIAAWLLGQLRDNLSALFQMFKHTTICARYETEKK